MSDCLTDAQICSLLSHRLSEDEQTQAESHLNVCSQCSNLLAEWKTKTQIERNLAIDDQDRTFEHQPDKAPKTPDHFDETIVQKSGAGPTDETKTGLSQPGSAFEEERYINPLTADDFFDCLLHSSLMSAEEISEFRESQDSEELNKDAQSAANSLLRNKKITQYQFEMLSQGRVRGLVMGKYIILRKLGEGGMGMVFEALHRKMKRNVALKVLPPAMTNSPTILNRFHREVEAVSRLQHPNIAAAFDADEEDGIHFLVMECVDGPDLSQYVKEAGIVPPGPAVQLMMQAAEGLAHAHGQGIVHRDIKPSNLIVNQKGLLKILDMGLAQIHVEEGEVRTELTQSGSVMGTVDYMAPEQAIDSKNVDLRADIYSLGCTLYFLLTAKPMSPEGTMTQKLLWHQTEASPSLLESCPDIPKELDAVYLQMTAKDPSQRQQSMEEVMDQLEQCLVLFPDAPLDLSWMGVELSASDSPTARTALQRRTLIGNKQAGTVADQTRVGNIAGQHSSKEAGKKGNIVYLCAAASILVVAAILGYLFFGQTPDDSSQIQIVNSPLAKGEERLVPNKVVAPLPIKTSAPYAKLIGWVLENGGSVSIVTEKGSNAVISKSEQIPRESFDLRSINLDSTSVRDQELAILQEAPQLQALSLAQTVVSDEGIDHILKLKELWSLNLSESRVGNKGVAKLVRLSQLRDLDLQKTAVTDQGLVPLANLKRLEKLYLSDTKIGDAGVRQIETMLALKRISLNGTYVTDEGYDSLAAALPKLDIAWDGRDGERSVANKLLDQGAVVSLITQSEQQLDQIVKKTDLPRERFHLMIVDLSNNPAIDDDDLKMLAALARVESLSLSGTKVTSTGLSHLKGLTTLKLIDLGALPISKSEVDALQSALSDCEIRQTAAGDLVAANWVLSKKGSVSVITPDGDILSEIQDPKQLPKGEFSLVEVHLDGVSDITNQDMEKLKDLSSLESLFLSNTGLSDKALTHLSSCFALRDLSLSGNPITSDGLQSLIKLSSLRRIYLANTKVDGSGVQQLSRLPNLSHLSLAETEITDGDLVHLKRLDQLTWLSLAKTSLSDEAIAQLGSLQGLKELLIDGAKLTDAGQEELAALLPDCKIVGDPLDLQRLTARWVLQQGGAVELDSGPVNKLEQMPRSACTVLSIDLEELPDISSEQITERLLACKQLKLLNLSATSIQDDDLAALGELTELEQLVLSGTNISDQGVGFLSPLLKLQTLDLRQTRVSGIAFGKFKNPASLIKLYLSNSRINDRGLSHINGFSNLETLDLSSNIAISNTGLANLKGLTKLRGLGLRGLRINDDGVTQLVSLKELNILNLEGTRVTDKSGAIFKTLTKMNSLQLGNTSVTDLLLPQLTELKQLTNLDLSRTKVSDEAVETLKKALPKCRITKSASRKRDSEDALDNDRASGGFRK